MIILGIETSCDETSLALVEDGKNILGSETFSQIKEHEAFGGVVPEVASRRHILVLPPLLQTLLKKTGVSKDQIDAIAVTNEPGLMGALIVGVSFANALAFGWDLPVIGVNHLESHIYSALITDARKVSFPLLGLVISGGHTMLVQMEAMNQYTILGSTLDDAVGEAYDKTAILLGLGYPGGPIIDKRSALGNEDAFALPVGMSKNKDSFNFSYSGLKTAVRNLKQKLIDESGSLSDSQINDFCASFQKSAIKSLMLKFEKAISECNPSSIFLCGGVAANRGLRGNVEALSKQFDLPLYVPPLSLCGDNAAMVAGLAFHKDISRSNGFVSRVRASGKGFSGI